MSKYLQIEFSSGNLFQYSKTQEEGFEEHVSKNNNISYRKYFKKGIFGVYMGTYLRDEGNFGKEVVVHMRDKDNEDIYITLLLFDAEKNIAPYAESYITVLPAMERGYAYRFFPYIIEKEGSKYKNYGVSVKHAFLQDDSVNESYPLAKLSYSYDKKDGDNITEVEGDIPKVEWEEDIDGSWKMITTKKRKFLYDVLVSNVTEFAGSSGGGVKKVTDGPAPQPVIDLNPDAPVEAAEEKPQTQATKTAPKKAQQAVAGTTAKQPTKQQVDSDDLPF